MTFSFEAEVRLLRWSDSSTAGRTTTFEIPLLIDRAHPFWGLPTGPKGGQRFKMTLVAIDDNEEPREPPVLGQEESRPPECVASATHAASGPGGAIQQKVLARSVAEKLRYAAFLRAVRDYPKNPDFQEWVARKSNWTAHYATESQAADYIRCRCYIETRIDIKTDETAYEKFVEMEAEFDAETPGRLAERRG